MPRYRIGNIIIVLAPRPEFGYPCGSSFISDRNKCYRDPKTGSRLKKPITRSIYDRIVKQKGKAAQSLYRDRESAIRNKRSEGARGWKKQEIKDNKPVEESQLAPLQGSEKQVAWANKIRDKAIAYLDAKQKPLQIEIDRAKRLDDWTGKDAASGVELQSGTLLTALRLGGLLEVTDMKEPESAMRALKKSIAICEKIPSASYWIDSNTFATDYHVTTAMKSYVKGIKAREAKKKAESQSK